jgi:hypothetical protein
LGEWRQRKVVLQKFNRKMAVALWIVTGVSDNQIVHAQRPLNIIGFLIVELEVGLGEFDDFREFLKMLVTVSSN